MKEDYKCQCSECQKKMFGKKIQGKREFDDEMTGWEFIVVSALGILLLVGIGIFIRAVFF